MKKLVEYCYHLLFIIQDVRKAIRGTRCHHCGARVSQDRLKNPFELWCSDLCHQTEVRNEQ